MIHGLATPGFDRLLSAVVPPAAPSPAALTPEQVKLREVAPKMETFFYQMLMKAMRATVPQNPYMGGGFAEQVWTGMLDDLLAEQAQGRGQGTGLAEAIIKRYDSHIKGMTRAKDKEATPESATEAAAEPESEDLKTEAPAPKR